MLDTVLFELEGVLAETAEERRDALLSTLHADGIPLSVSEYQETCAGLALEDAVRAALRLRDVSFDDTRVSLTVLRAERAYRAFIGKGLTLVEGTRETVERLLAVARLGIVTRATRSEVELVSSLAGLEHAFSCVVAAEDTSLGKPSPEPYLLALARLQGQRPARGLVLALEDGLPGIRAAHAAGLRCVVVGEVPAHVALEADGYLPAITGLVPETLPALVARKREPII